MITAGAIEDNSPGDPGSAFLMFFSSSDGVQARLSFAFETTIARHVVRRSVPLNWSSRIEHLHSLVVPTWSPRKSRLLRGGTGVVLIIRRRFEVGDERNMPLGCPQHFKWLLVDMFENGASMLFALSICSVGPAILKWSTYTLGSNLNSRCMNDCSHFATVSKPTDLSSPVQCRLQRQQTMGGHKVHVTVAAMGS